MNNKIKVGVIGGAGYTGGELLRLLINHACVEIAFVHSKSNAGKKIHTVHTDLEGETLLTFTDDLTGLSTGTDVLFLCVGHGDAKKFLEENKINDSIVVIDLSQDFRLRQNAVFGNREFIYGLPELNKTTIRSAKNIANPGCFATAIQLALLPLAHAALLGQVYVTGITGSTGAGQSLAATSHFSWRVNNIQAYKTLQHQHLNEISESLQQLQPSFPLYHNNENAGETNLSGLNFVPWRGDFSRGIFVSAQLYCNTPLETLQQLYSDFYREQPFVVISKNAIHLKQVVNSNKGIIQLEKKNNQLAIHCAIDNLLKGASGQAVQNMNLIFGFDEKEGLRLKSPAF